MEQLKALFSDSGDVSMMRLLALLVTLAACALAFTGADTALVLGMLGIAFGAKIGQKTLE